LNRSAPDCGYANNPHVFVGEVIRPSITPRVEEWSNLPSLGIDPRQVRASVKIATVACERQILRIAWASVLLCDYVLDMMPQLAVFLA
jgi:hypothetical protein